MMLTKEDQDRILLSEMQHLAEIIHQRAYSHVPQWRVSSDCRGVLSQLDNMTAGLIERLEKLNAAISWVEPPFVDESTPATEMRARIRLLIADAARAQGMAPEGRGREGGPGSEELPSPVVADDAPKGESS